MAYARLASTNAAVSRLAQQDKVPWYMKPNLRLLYLLMFPTCLGVVVANGFHASMMNGLQAVPSWLEYYQHPRSGMLGFMSAMYSLGGIVAVPFVPSIVDKLGRRHAILFGSIITTIGGILQGTSLDFIIFTIARFILGFGTVFAVVAACALVGELSHPKERAVMSSLLSASYMIGYMTSAGVILWTFSIPNDWGWRIPSFLQVVPSLLPVSFIWFLPESPRWLISKRKQKEAYTILVKYHAEGDESSEFAKAEYTQIEQTLAEESQNAQMSWKQVLSTAGIRRRVIIASFLGLFVTWSGYGLIANFLPPVLDSIGIHDNRTKNIVNFTKAGWNLVNSTIFALTVPRYPRRRIFLTCTISLLIVLGAWTAASAEYSRTRSLISSQIVLVLIFLYSPAFNVGFTVLTPTFLVELFPFYIRARGVAIYQWWSRASGFVTQFVDPIGIDAAGWRYYLVYCAWIAFEVAFIYFVFPETSGRTLEELTFLFEGDQMPRVPEVEPLLQNHRETYDVVEDNSRGV